MSSTSEASWVRDVREDNWRALSVEERRTLRDWAYDNDIPVTVTYRIEVEIIDAPLARVFTYDVDEQGRHYYAAGHDIAVQPPNEQAIRTLPPGWSDTTAPAD